MNSLKLLMLFFIPFLSNAKLVTTTLYEIVQHKAVKIFPSPEPTYIWVEVVDELGEVDVIQTIYHQTFTLQYVTLHTPLSGTIGLGPSATGTVGNPRKYDKMRVNKKTGQKVLLAHE